LRSSNHNRKRKVGGTHDNNNAPSKLLCMVCDELKNDLATILNVRSENLVETLTILLCKLNDTGAAMDESLTVDSSTHFVEAAAASAAAVSATAVLVAAEAATVSAAAVITAAEISAAAAVTAAEILQPPPVVYTLISRDQHHLK
jgi:hypothetical protein